MFKQKKKHNKINYANFSESSVRMNWLSNKCESHHDESAEK